ncbi:hypothetical protein [Mycobacterium sp. 155]|uniref:hypothetical protein n=1 Tax=Mycobacterium sp. 155 TaxID=1157943 RepID=UPI0012FBC919|nr:hypothetical protein [Mycobacterium sp. 155]
MKRRHAVLISAVAGAMALSACSTHAPSETRAWPTPSPVAADVPVTDTAAPAPAAPRFVWQDVTGQGHEADRDATRYRAQFGADPAPGIEIVHATGSQPGDTVPCTLGPAVDKGWLTAGHCARDFSADQYLMGSATGDPQLLGTASAPAGPVDAAVVRTSGATVTKIAGTWPVAGVLTPKGVRDLVRLGDPVCFDGAVSGVVCGERLSDDADGLLVFSHAAQHGDSGAPLFLVDSVTHNAALIGIVKSTDTTSAHATYIEAALLATGTLARLDPGVTAFGSPVSGQFSQRITSQ